MPKPKVTYFDFPGSRGEEVRLALWLADVEFDDNRLASADWPALKPNTPFGSLPMFEIEGRPPLAQVNAILVLIGRMHDLHPKDNWTAAEHEALMCAVEDLRHTTVAAMRVKDPEANKQGRLELAEGYLTNWGGFVERRLGNAGPFLAGETISVADIKLYMAHKWFASGSVDHVRADVFAKYERLTRLAQAFAEHPKIKAWYAR